MIECRLHYLEGYHPGEQRSLGRGALQSKGKEAFLIFHMHVFDSGSLPHESGGPSRLA